MAFNWFKKDETKIAKAMVKFSKARAQVYIKYPRLYDALDLCHVQMNSDCPTLGVAPKRNGEFDFVWNPTFINTLSDKQTEAVVKHELLHIVFEHTTNRLPHYDFDVFDPDANKKLKADDVIKARLWNIATDCSINQFIREELNDPNGAKMELCFPEKFQMPEWLNAEAYYRLLAEQMKDQLDMLKELQKQLVDAHQQWEQEGQEGQGQPQQGQGGEGDGEEGEGKEQKESTAGHGGASDADPTGGKTNEINASDIGKGKDGKEKKDGKGKEGKEEKGKDSKAQAEKDAEDKEANEQAIKDIQKDMGVDQFNAQADRAAASQQQGGKGAGKYGGVGAQVVKMDFGAGIKSTPGWMRKTKHESIHGFDIVIEATRKRPNRRYGNVFPGKKRQDTGNKLLLAVDISGSISLDLFKQFTLHVNKFTRFSSFDIVFFNDYLVDESGKVLFSAYEPNADPRKAIRHFRLNQKQRLGGGTNFEPIMLLWNKVSNQYDGLFIFTDGDASYSTKPKHSRAVNWVAYPSGDYNKLSHLADGNVWNMNNEKLNREMPKVR